MSDPRARGGFSRRLFSSPRRRPFTPRPPSPRRATLASGRTRTSPKLYAQWTSEPRYGSPLVDHLPIVAGIPTPKHVLGYYIGAPKTLTYYADILKYYRALAAATPRVKVETIGKSDEGRELVVVWVSSDENMKNLAQNRANLAKLADPRGQSDAQIKQLIATTKPHYHLMGGLHSGETGPSEMLMELVYRLATETSPLITQIRNNVIVSVTPAADPDGRDRNVDWFYRGLEVAAQTPPVTPADSAARAAAPGGGGRRGGIGGLPYWGKYIFHDNNRDINLSQMSMRAITDWYFTAHPPIMHDLHEAQALMYTYSGGPPQNPNLDPLLFAELPFFSNWEMSQMTKWGMPGVYTHAFMDGWSPGYLGSVAYNHNGMMRMYETQSGVDRADSAARPAANAAAAPTGAPPAATSVAPPAGRGGAVADSAANAGGRRSRTRWTRRRWRRSWKWGCRCRTKRGSSRWRATWRRIWRRTRGRDSDWSRRWTAARVVSRHPDSAGRGAGLFAPQQHQLHGDRRVVGAPADVDVPEQRPRELLHQDAQLGQRRHHQGAVRLRLSRCSTT